jgi:hypothetical protein
MIRIVTLIFFLSTSNLLGSEYYWMQTNTKGWKNSYRYDFLEGRLGEKVLISLDSIYSQIPNSYFFFYNGEELQSYVSCGFDIYSIDGEVLELKYNYYNRGYTCYSTPFVRDSTNYLLGGHGFWTNHFDLLRFDKIHGSWEIVKTKNQPLDYVSNGVYQNSKGIYSLFGGRENFRIGLSEKVPNGYFLDWESKVWSEIEISIEGVDNVKLVENSGLRFLQSKDYFYIVSNSGLETMGWNIIEKESGKIYFFDELKNEDVFLSPFIEVIGNKVNYQSPNGTPKSLDLESLFSKSKQVGQIRVKEDSSEIGGVFPFRDIVYILIITLLILILIYFYLRKIRTKTNTIIPNQNRNEEIENILKSLSKYSSQSLSTQQLDEVLRIDSLVNEDTKRLKRSRWINKLNELQNSMNGTDLIVRDKSVEDKRFVFYRINK